MAFISEMQPMEVLAALQEIEASINTEKHRNPDGSYKDRVLDIDIMDVEGIIMDTPELTIPTPTSTTDLSSSNLTTSLRT